MAKRKRPNKNTNVSEENRKSPATTQSEPDGTPESQPPGSTITHPGNTVDRRKIGLFYRFKSSSLIIIITAITLLNYSNNFNADFTLDDFHAVYENHLIRDLSNIGEIFATNYWGFSEKYGDKSLYRPLTVTTYALNHAVHKLKPEGYHVINVLLHTLVSILLFLVVRDVFEDRQLAFISAIIFGVHTIHTEAVSGVVGRAEVLALLGSLFCCWTYERVRRLTDRCPFNIVCFWTVLSVIGYLSGMLSKETGVIAPAVIILWEMFLPQHRFLFHAHKRAIFLFAGYTVAVILYFALRNHAVASRNINIGFVDVDKNQRIYTALRVCLEYVGLHLFPYPLSADYWITDIPIARHIWEPGVAVALAVLIFGTIIAIGGHKRYPAISWGLAFFGVTLFPVSNLPFPIGVMKAERLLYTPSAGLVVAIACLLSCAFNHRKTRMIGASVFFSFTLMLIVMTWRRNLDWKSNVNLAMATMKTSPESLIFNTILADWYRENGQNAKAREHLLKSIKGDPVNAISLYNLGNIELDEGQYDEAIKYYRRVLELDPTHSGALNNLGRVFLELRQYSEAREVFYQIIRQNPDSPGSYVNLFTVYFILKQPMEIIDTVRDAVKRFPDSAPLLLNAGAILNQAGFSDEAQKAIGRAYQVDPNVGKQVEVRANMD